MFSQEYYFLLLLKTPYWTLEVQKFNGHGNSNQKGVGLSKEPLLLILIPTESGGKKPQSFCQSHQEDSFISKPKNTHIIDRMIYDAIKLNALRACGHFSEPVITFRFPIQQQTLYLNACRCVFGMCGEMAGVCLLLQCDNDCHYSAGKNRRAGRRPGQKLDKRNNAFGKGRSRTCATTAQGAVRTHAHTRMHALTNRRVSDTQAETHKNDHLTDINLAPNEPFKMPITDYCYFMRSVMQLDGKTAESLNSFGNVCQRPFRTNSHSP